MRITGKYVILSLVLFVLGFLVAYSFQVTNKNNSTNIQMNESAIKKETVLRNQIVQQQELNYSLKQNLYDLQSKVREKEKSIGAEEELAKQLAEDISKLRMLIGYVKVRGPGVEVTLDDAESLANKKDVSNYIVHEGQVFAVINELFASGAEVIAVNGQRISRHSYISCVGPVIRVDGVEHPAPFKISAIGNSGVLVKALNAPNGIKEQLVNENIIVKIEKKQEIILQPIFHERKLTDG